MRKHIAAVLRVLPIIAIILLGVHAIGIFDNGDQKKVDDMKFASGGFDYSGSLKSGLFSGYGTIKFQDGSKYSGGFTDGRFDGKAIYNYSGNADTSEWYFDGIFQNGQIGNGTLYLSNGSGVLYYRDLYTDALIGPTWRYTGRFNENGQSIAGTFTFQDGSVYAGSFQNGFASGEGTFIDADGNLIYIGGFEDGLFDGTGTYYSPEGWVYEGSFKDGLFEGEGSVTDKENIVRGIWEKGGQITRYE